MSTQAEKIKELVELRAKARLGGGEKAIEKQHEKGKYTARERIAMLLDEGSFEEMDMFVQHRCTNFGMEKKHYLGFGVCFCTGFYNQCRFSVGDVGKQDLQDYGHSHESWCSCYWIERLWWRTSSGGYQRIGGLL